MIKLTVKQLLDAAGNGANGALNRYFTLEKPVAVAWKNRKQLEACNAEIKLFHERRIALCEKYGKKNPKTNNYEFDVPETESTESPPPPPATPGPQRKLFDLAMEELNAQAVDTIPGEPVSVSTLTGVLSEADGLLLEPFLTD